VGEALRLDAQALHLLRADVNALSDDELSSPTPCAGWQVTDLLCHMTDEHERIVTHSLYPGAAGRRSPACVHRQRRPLA
jgi:uncharacterized protein (TIGR03083 family)